MHNQTDHAAELLMVHVLVLCLYAVNAALACRQNRPVLL